MLGLERGAVRLVPYHPEWPALFARERDALRRALGGLPAEIEHVGSTAVPGLSAKPILDLLAGLPDGVADGAALALYRAAFERAGYEYRGEYGIPGRHYFIKGEPRTHHLHVVGRASEFWRTHVLFRDQLRADAEVARAYDALKRELAERHAADREAYTEGKSEFIARVVRAAPAPPGVAADTRAP